jgi:hypothetical protein
MGITALMLFLALMSHQSSLMSVLVSIGFWCWECIVHEESFCLYTGVIHISDVVHSALEQFGFWNGINKTGIL